MQTAMMMVSTASDIDSPTRFPQIRTGTPEISEVRNRPTRMPVIHLTYWVSKGFVQAIASRMHRVSGWRCRRR